MPAVFVRFGNCNLKCRWCDTKYTWDPAVRDNFEAQLPSVFEKIRQWPECKRLVITGGEPMLQQESIIALRAAFPPYYIEVETNGSMPATKKCEQAVNLFTVSYKTSNSGNEPYELKTRNKKCVYKFVADSPKDFAEIEEVIERYGLPAGKIILMPQGISEKELAPKHDFIIEQCKKKGYRFSPRLHVLLWGAQRGV